MVVTVEGVVASFQMAYLAATLLLVMHPLFFIKRKHIQILGVSGPTTGTARVESSARYGNMIVQGLWFITTMFMAVSIFLTLRQAFVVDEQNPLFVVEYAVYFGLLSLFLILWWSWGMAMFAWRRPGKLPRVVERVAESLPGGAIVGLSLLIISWLVWLALALQYALHFTIGANSVSALTADKFGFWTAFIFHILTVFLYGFFILLILSTRDGLQGGGWVAKAARRVTQPLRRRAGLYK